MAALGVYSEVGKLRKVLVHRPDLSLKRLAPSNCEEQLPRSIVVTAYQSASGLLNLITPTSVIIMGALAVARTGYDR